MYVCVCIDMDNSDDSGLMIDVKSVTLAIKIKNLLYCVWCMLIVNWYYKIHYSKRSIVTTFQWLQCNLIEIDML